MSPLELVDDSVRRSSRGAARLAAASPRRRCGSGSQRSAPSLRRADASMALAAPRAQRSRCVLWPRSLCVAAAIGLVHSGSREHRVRRVRDEHGRSGDTQASMSRSPQPERSKLSLSPDRLAPARRLQQYEADPDACGYKTRTSSPPRRSARCGWLARSAAIVASASFDVPAHAGSAASRRSSLRVPVGSVQAALADALGARARSSQQKISIQDVRSRSRPAAARIAADRSGAIASIAARLASPSAASDGRRLEQQLAADARQLATMLKRRAGTVRRADLARDSSRR